MDHQQSAKMPKPFDNEHDLRTSNVHNENAEGFHYRDDERLKQIDEYRQELMKVQDEIITLRQVLAAKLKRESELKSLLGIRFVDDLKNDLNETVHDIKSTTAYQKTAETLQAATNRIAPTLQTVNSKLKFRLGTIRNSNYFKTFENTLDSTVNAVKSKMTSSKSVMTFDKNDNNDFTKYKTTGSMVTSVTHDEHLNFSSNSDEKQDLSNK